MSGIRSGPPSSKHPRVNQLHTAAQRIAAWSAPSIPLSARMVACWLSFSCLANYPLGQDRSSSYGSTDIIGGRSVLGKIRMHCVITISGADGDRSAYGALRFLGGGCDGREQIRGLRNDSDGWLGE